MLWSNKIVIPQALRKELCRLINCDKMFIWSGLKKAAPIFLQYRMDTVICQDTLDISLLEWSAAKWKQTDIHATQQSLSGYMISSSPRTLPQFLSGTVHFFVISCVARYNAFKRAVSLGNTLLCLFKRRYPLFKLSIAFVVYMIFSLPLKTWKSVILRPSSYTSSSLHSDNQAPISV